MLIGPYAAVLKVVFGTISHLISELWFLEPLFLITRGRVNCPIGEFEKYRGMSKFAKESSSILTYGNNLRGINMHSMTISKRGIVA